MENSLPKLGNPALRALNNAGISTLEQLAKHTEAEIKKLHGMGPHALKTLRVALEAQGLSFKV
jgi:predicted flap endonuclease-1-like 5' DNA nuclease